MKKILVSGTGRSGTTFIMLIYTFLGFNTGFDSSNYLREIYEISNAGLEKNYDTPFDIVKSPQFVHKIPEIINSGIEIELMIIPIRDYEKSASSRVRNGPIAGGLWNANNQEEQVNFYHKIMAEYLVDMVDYNIPTLFISFEQMVNSPEYLFNKLKPTLKNTTYDQFLVAYNNATEQQRA